MPIADAGALTKVCGRCGTERSVEDFGHDWNAKDGYKSRCKPCDAECMRKYRRTDRGVASIRATQKKWYLRKKEDGFFKTEEEKKRQRGAYRRWLDKSPRFNLYMALRHAVKRRPSDNPITLDHLMEVWGRQKNICAISGVEMTWSRGALMPTSISLDRIDQSKGYEMGNVRLVCYQANTFRGRWSDQQMLSMARSIVERAGPNYEIPLSFGA